MDTADAQTNNAGPPLIADIERARSALKTALLQIGLILRFHRDARALGVQSYAARAPSSLQTALKDALRRYKQACDAMETVIMRARAAAMVELIKQDPRYAQASTKTDSNQQSIAKEPDSERKDLEMDATVAKDATMAEAGVQQEQKPLQSVLAGIIDDDEMDDLFGPGTGSTSAAANTPQAGGNAGRQALPDLSSAAQSTSNPSGLVNDFSGPLEPADVGNSLGLDLTTNSQPMAQQSSFSGISDMQNFGQQDLSGMGTLSGDDFNALLAGLGGGGNGNSDDLMQGFTLDNFDLSSILGGTDPNNMQQ